MTLFSNWDIALACSVTLAVSSTLDFCKSIISALTKRRDDFNSSMVFEFVLIISSRESALLLRAVMMFSCSSCNERSALGFFEAGLLDCVSGEGVHNPPKSSSFEAPLVVLDTAGYEWSESFWGPFFCFVFTPLMFALYVSSLSYTDLNLFSLFKVLFWISLTEFKHFYR